MLFNFFGKKEDKGFAPDTVIDLGNGKTAKLADVMKIANSILSQEAHQIDGSQEIELANGKKVKLEDAIKAYNAATDKGETEDEKKNREEAEGKDKKKAENAVKFKNCGCGGEKDGIHAQACKMYNSDGSDKEKGSEDEKMKNALTTLENEVKALKLKNEALEAASKNMDSFVKLEAAKKGQTDVVLENSTKESGTLDSKLENSKKFFVAKKTA